MAKFALYIPYSELHDNVPSTLEGFRAGLAAFSRIKILHICSAMNAALREDRDPRSRRAHDRLIQDVFPQHTAKRLLRQEENVRFVFHRQQLLFIMKEALLSCRDDGKIPAAPDDAFGDIFLMASDHLPLQTPKPDALEDKFVWIAANLLPVQEASAFNDFDLSIVRSQRMLFEALPKVEGKPHFNIPAMFEDITGIPLMTFHALEFGALTKFMKFDVESFMENPGSYSLQREWFSSTKVPAAQVDAFLSFSSATPDQFASELRKHNSGPNDYTIFRDKPLFRDGNLFFLIDFSFLAEKIESAPFWTVHSTLENSDRNQFHSFWGRVFELYAKDLLGSAIDGRLNALYRNPVFDGKPNEEVCDAILVCDDSAVFIEFKGATFTSNAKYGNDPALLRSELDRKLVRGGKQQAVEQLCRSIHAVSRRTDPERVTGVDLRRVSTIFPLIIARDDIGSTVGVNAFLNCRFQECFKQKEMVKTITPLFCLSSGDLERLTNYLAETKLTDILEAHYKVCRRKGRYLSEPLFTAEGNKLLDNSRAKPRILSQAWQKVAKRMLDELGLDPK